jgi:hypothetical protein
MNGATGRVIPRPVTVEDEPEPGDPPPRPYSPSPPPPQPSTDHHQNTHETASGNEGPALLPMDSQTPEVMDIDTPAFDEPEYMTRLQYTNSLIRQATMPILPPDLDDFDIPPSPPGSPDPNLTSKLDNFQQLRDRGIYFNDRLASNKSFRNPQLLGKLSGYVGIDDEYGTNLPPSIWDPHGFTRDQYHDVIAEKQRQTFDALQERQRTEQRTSIEFASASNKSAAERILEGVNSRPTSRPQSRTGSDSDRSKARWDERRDRHRGRDDRHEMPRSRDRSPRDRGSHARDGARHRDRDYYRR